MPKAYLVIETELRDPAALPDYVRQAQVAIAAAGGRRIAPVGGNTIALVGAAPKRIGITEWDSLQQALAWRESAAFSKLALLRDKAVKTIRVFVIEGAEQASQ
ncbi:MAG TPA: DUF1330 domain-containing protein [Xanthobacteraceae bacterium]|nr:DUF1330 domain-containing protein [Xanthobacteraceae bacterium]